MKSTNRSTLAWSLAAALPFVVACGGNDNSGLFSQASGGHSTSLGGSLSTGGGSSTRGGSTSGGTASSNGGASAAGNVGGSGQGQSGSSTGVGGGMNAGGMNAGGMNAGGMNAGGMSVGGMNAGGMNAGGMNAGGAHGGTGGTSTGGTSTGGTSAGGTGGGSSGSGGSGGPDACPVDAPGPSTACMVSTPGGCFYPGFACTCMPPNGGGPSNKLKWACFGSRALCAQELPVTGDPCSGHGGAQCPYSSTDFCSCNLSQNQNQNPKWQCSAGNGFTCPDSAPNNGNSCDAVAICQYPDGACACNGTNGARWACQGG